MQSSSIRLRERFAAPTLVFIFTLFGFLVMGYHPGLEDDGIYLAGVKFRLNPGLFPHDADFFRRQLQASIFDRWIAAWVHLTHMPVAWAELTWQFLSLFATLWAAYAIARRLFPDARAHWAGVGMLASMLTLPVAGTALNVADQHLHPRNMATALLLLAIDRILARRPLQALPLVLLALAVHPIMGALGASFCLFLALTMTDQVPAWLRTRASGNLRVRSAADPTPEPATEPTLTAAVPLGWLLERPSPTWRAALASRRYYFLAQWTWYEWLGALGPLVLFWGLWRMAARRGETMLERFALAVFLYGIFQQAVAMVMLETPALVRLTPLQPMRYLQMVYVFLILIAGCLLGRYVLGRNILRWAVFLVAVSAGMFAAQRSLYADSQHLELPGRAPTNPWLQAFAWIRQNTPGNAYFALDPYYLEAPGEDFHSFRALAERSQLADAVKDTAVVTQVPDLGPRAARELAAQIGWSQFQLRDFQHLKAEFGVDWVLVRYPAAPGLDCAWHNATLSVCSIPGGNSLSSTVFGPPHSSENPVYDSFLVTEMHR